MIRAFICPWVLVGNSVQNPITEQGESIITGAFTCSMFYPDADADGKPDGSHVLVLVDGVSVEALKDLSGVKMLPAYRFSKPVSEIPAGVKQGILDYALSKGIPSSVFIGVVVYGDFLKRLAKHFQVNFEGFGRYETDRDGDFS